mmetsp:Transcript_49892/g.154163  ORF Transcript_49892/g.154163 Transcript_49892/m.154163 type:complete len:232 (-) Transcript_49892:2239-2934(-)
MTGAAATAAVSKVTMKTSPTRVAASPTSGSSEAGPLRSGSGTGKGSSTSSGSAASAGSRHSHSARSLDIAAKRPADAAVGIMTPPTLTVATPAAATAAAARAPVAAVWVAVRCRRSDSLAAATAESCATSTDAVRVRIGGRCAVASCVPGLSAAEDVGWNDAVVTPGPAGTVDGGAAVVTSAALVVVTDAVFSGGRVSVSSSDVVEVVPIVRVAEAPGSTKVGGSITGGHE